MNYGLIERAPDGTENVLTVSYNHTLRDPPIEGQRLNFEESDRSSREMEVIEVAERPDVARDLLFVIVQPV